MKIMWDDMRKVGIEETIQHNNHYKTFIFDRSTACTVSPGQFFMVYLPGIGEKPISLSSSTTGELSITVEKKGLFTEKLFELVQGDSVYVRGPYGTRFGHKHEPGLGIAGGCGIAPILSLADEFVGCRNEFKILYGAKDKYHLIFEGPESVPIKFATEDGSFGYHGFVTDLIDKKIVKNYNQFAICGPEIMMKSAAEKLVELGVAPENIELSLERYMKCGEGLCGLCECSGRRVCVDGPVFNYTDVLKMPDFGKAKREKSGKKVKL